MYRTKINNLITWKISKKRKPLIFLGARQVGKNLQAASFKLFCKKNNPQTAIRTSLTDYKEEDWMTNIPLYAINTI